MAPAATRPAPRFIQCIVITQKLSRRPNELPNRFAAEAHNAAVKKVRTQREPKRAPPPPNAVREGPSGKKGRRADRKRCAEDELPRTGQTWGDKPKKTDKLRLISTLVTVGRRSATHFQPSGQCAWSNAVPVRCSSSSLTKLARQYSGGSSPRQVPGRSHSPAVLPAGLPGEDRSCRCPGHGVSQARSHSRGPGELGQNADASAFEDRLAGAGPRLGTRQSLRPAHHRDAVRANLEAR